jgi:hypothetical protein
LDGWTSPSGKSLWNFIIHFGNGRDILWKIRDFSGESHTAEFLAQQIQLIIEEIGIQKFAGIVTDAGSNVHSARNLISGRFPHILNIRCIAHSLNLITKDLIKHTFAKKIIQWCAVIVTYFKKSHRPKELLELKILEKQIDGGGLKTYLDTRWTTVYEMLNSISRLELCLKEVVQLLLFDFLFYNKQITLLLILIFFFFIKYSYRLLMKTLLLLQVRQSKLLLIGNVGFLMMSMIYQML